jgi:hypothetical protein
MRLFIDICDIEKTQKKLEKLNKMLMKTDHKLFIYSNEGIFNIDTGNTYKLIIEDKPPIIFKNYYNGSKLTIDESYIKKEVVYQLAVDHFAILKKMDYYSMDNNSQIKFVIVSYMNNILDYYFEVPNETRVFDKLFQSNFFEFLSLLN